MEPPVRFPVLCCAQCAEPIPSDQDSDMFCSERCGDLFDADLRNPDA